MTAPATLEERVTIVEETVKQLITSLHPPDSALKKINRDIQKLNRTTGIAHGGILELITESEEVQELQKKTIETVAGQGRELAGLKTTVAEHGRQLTEIKTTVAEHGRELTEIKTTLNEHGSTLNEHSRELTEIKTTLNEHGTMLKEHGTMLRELSATLNVVVTKLDER